MVYEYTGFNFDRIENLRFDEYLSLRRDAYINMLNQSENGKEYLEKCWILEQTEPDVKTLREVFSK